MLASTGRLQSFAYTGRHADAASNGMDDPLAAYAVGSVTTLSGASRSRR